MVDPGRVERITATLRDLHAQVYADPPLPYDEWELALYSYDEALVTAVDIFDLEIPPAWRDELGPEDRAAVEQALVEAGLEAW